MNLSDRIKVPEFDPAIIARHITRDFILACMMENFSDTMTDDDVLDAVPSIHARHGGQSNLEHSKMMTDKIIAIMEELREVGLLQKIPAGEERGLSEVKAWNKFVEGGAASLESWYIHSLMRCPLPYAINHGAWSAIYETRGDMRKAIGLKPYIQKGNPSGLMDPVPVSPADIEIFATAAALGTASKGAGMTTELMVGRSDLRCHKTDESLAWKEEARLAPVIGKWHYPPRDSGKPSFFEEIPPLELPKPVRQVEITLPSGILMMADWFRIPGFTEGVGDDDYSKPSINSDLGIDERTRDHYERLGLMRIHTGNCVPQLVQDGDAIRVGHFDEDSDLFWNDDGAPSGVKMPEMAGRVCCDLWDVTFSDREILIDILMAGASKIEANDGIGDREREVTGYPTSREEAGEMLDAYVKEHDLPRLEYEPGQVLQVSMATGHGSMTFHEHFKSPDLADWPAMEDMFVISMGDIQPEPSIADGVDRADWSWPERYAVTPSPSCGL